MLGPTDSDVILLALTENWFAYEQACHPMVIGNGAAAPTTSSTDTRNHASLWTQSTASGVTSRRKSCCTTTKLDDWYIIHFYLFSSLRKKKTCSLSLFVLFFSLEIGPRQWTLNEYKKQLINLFCFLKGGQELYADWMQVPRIVRLVHTAHLLA